MSARRGGGAAWPPPRTWLVATGLVLATRAVFLLVAAATDAALASGPPDGLDVWRRWDADLFLKIAAHGYHGEGTDAWAEAFFPLLPLIVRGLGALGLPLLAAGMLVTTVASVVAVAYLAVLADDEAGRGAGLRAATYLLVFPTAVFLVAPYSEALFLAGAIPAFVHARRGEWVPTALFGAVAVGSRLAGVFVLAGLAVGWFLEHRRDRRGLAAIAVATAPLLGYLGWLWAVRGTPLFLLEAQREGWGRRLATPTDAFRTTVRAAEQAEGWLAVTWRLEVVAAALGVGVVLWALRRRAWRDAVYVGGLFGLLLVSTWYYSLPRILLSAFPMYVYLADWAGRAPWRHAVVLAVSAPLAALGTVVFTRGAWFF